jgi:hypothetical protein
MYLVYYVASHTGKMMPLFCILNLNATFNLNLNLASTFKPKPWLNLDSWFLNP